MAKGVVILAIGQKHDRSIATAVESYEQRLRSRLPLTWRLLSPSPQTHGASRRDESASVMRELQDEDYVVLLDERGTQLTSEAFSDVLRRGVERPLGRVVFVIGGAYGVDESVRSRANVVLSLSKLVFPHQLVRLILAEQIYRATAIADRHPYHHV